MSIRITHQVHHSVVAVYMHSRTHGVARDMLRRGVRVQAQARRNLGGGGGLPKRVDTGLLRSSIYVRPAVIGGEAGVQVGTGVRYACILGGGTRVVTSDGPKAICQVAPGDLVLTQTGEFRKVLACSKFPVTEKPDLVEIEVPWRRGKSHRLTVTTDHKILISRGGVKKWIPAGELRMTDELHVRTKQAHNRGAGPKRVCEACHGTFTSRTSQGLRFCSPPCRDRYWRDNGHWMLGRERGAEFSQRQSVARKLLYAEHPELHPNRVQPRVTDIEKTVATWLLLRGVNFEHRKHVNGIWPDFYAPCEHRIYEADGAYWHRDQAVDVLRDQRLLRELPGVEIVHIHFRDVRFTPDLDPNPLPGVHYVTVNPSTESFVEPTEFEGRRPASIKRYRFQRSTKPRASSVPMLYDLAVEGIHSFLANGVLVSNSLVHDGTGIYGPRGGMIRPTRGRFLVFTPKSGGVVFARQVRGMRPNPFLKNALIAARG